MRYQWKALSSLILIITLSEAFDGNLNGSRKNNMHGSMHMDPNRQKRTTKNFNVNMIIALFFGLQACFMLNLVNFIWKMANFQTIS